MAGGFVIEPAFVALRPTTAVVRLGFALLTIAAIVVQAASNANFDPVNYFSYFTIDSNLIAAALLLAGAAMWRRETTPALDFLRGAAVVYMTVTGVVFTLLLSGTDVDTAIPWVNTVVHEAGPLFILADWLVLPPRRRISSAQSILWLAFPLVWTIYTLIRGAVSGRYPYPFLNPANGGYATVTVYMIVILIFMLLLSLAVARTSRVRGEPSIAPSETKRSL